MKQLFTTRAWPAKPTIINGSKLMPTKIGSIQSLKKAYESCSQKMQSYFEHIPLLLDNKDIPLEICLAYVFFRLEHGQRMALYCGLARIHKVIAELALDAVGNHYITRTEYGIFYEKIFNFEPPNNAPCDLESAQKTRNRIMHGNLHDKNKVEDKDIRNAIASVLRYAEAINRQLDTKHQLEPFGPLQGFAGGPPRLNQKESQSMLKNMGF